MRQLRAFLTPSAWWSMAVFWLLMMQIVLGVADILLLAPLWMQILHLLGADLYWVALVALTGAV